jgi:hypothetical protein
MIFRHPAKLVLLDIKTGAVTQQLDVCGDADDVFFDTKWQRIYVSRGVGAADVFQSEPTGYRPRRAPRRLQAPGPCCSSPSLTDGTSLRARASWGRMPRSWCFDLFLETVRESRYRSGSSPTGIPGAVCFQPPAYRRPRWRSGLPLRRILAAARRRSCRH